MREEIIFLAALIIVGTTIWIVGSLIVDAIIARKNQRKKEEKEIELRTLRLDMKNGDEQAKLKMQEQLLHFEDRYKKAKSNTRDAKKELENFKRIFELLDPELQEEMQTIQLPKNLNTLSYERKGSEDRVFLYMDDLENYLKTQEVITEQK